MLEVRADDLASMHDSIFECDGSKPLVDATETDNVPALREIAAALACLVLCTLFRS